MLALNFRSKLLIRPQERRRRQQQHRASFGRPQPAAKSWPQRIFRHELLGTNLRLSAPSNKDIEAFRTLVESLVQMTTFISRIFLKSVEVQFKVPT